MTEIKAALFDFGGTLFDYRTLRAAGRESMLELLGWAGVDTDQESLRKANRASSLKVFTEYLNKSYYDHRDLFFDIAEGTLRELGGTLNDELFDRYRASQWEKQARDFELREGTMETLARLREKGIHLGIVSNIDEDQLDHFLDLSKLRPVFDSTLSSEKAGSCKPDQVIFDIALSRAGCKAEEALFIGDMPEADIAGANQFGMQSVLIWDRDDREPPIKDHKPAHIIKIIPDLLDIV